MLEVEFNVECLLMEIEAHLYYIISRYVLKPVELRQVELNS